MSSGSLLEPLETPATSTSIEARYERFRVHYTHVTLDSHWPLEGGGTLRAVQIEHPLAQVEAVEASQVHVGDGL